MRTEHCEVYLTGSSAQMRGRALSWEIFTFSFREFLDFMGIESDSSLSTKKRLFVQKAFEDYRERGGFPEVLALKRNLRIKIHHEYFHTILFRDLIERHDVAHPRAVTDLAHRLMDNMASLYSVNSPTGYLKSLGHNVPKSAVSDYLEWFEDAYFIACPAILYPSSGAFFSIFSKAWQEKKSPWAIFSDLPSVSSLVPGNLHPSRLR